MFPDVHNVERWSVLLRHLERLAKTAGCINGAEGRVFTKPMSDARGSIPGYRQVVIPAAFGG
jgi:hypothetical protein